MKKKNHSQKAKEARDSTKAKVCRFLKITHDQYSEMQFNEGLEWLKNGTWGIHYDLRKSKLFWAWWKTTYSMVDLKFVLKWFDCPEEFAQLEQREIIDYFKGEHFRLVNKFTPTDYQLKKMNDEVKAKENATQLIEA